MMRSLLVEIGVEELPASFVARAMELMPSAIAEALRAARLTFGAVRAFGTPRRLAVLVEDVPEVQPDLEEDVVGPPKAVAFAADGSLTKAAEGFAKKAGVPVSAVRLVESEKGAYAVARRTAKGGATLAALAPLVEAAIAKTNQFPKSMRWADGTHSFGRPVQWLVALFGHDVVDAQAFGLVAGRVTRGHRFLGGAPIELAEAREYEAKLREVHVLASSDARRRAMLEAIEKAASDAGGTVVDDAFLVEENLSLVEEPHVLCGAFDARFLELPDEVIVAVMRGHQRYFAVRDREGRLLPRYLCVVNTALDPKAILRGNDRVLRARLSDARFFVDEDRKRPLADRIQKLDGVVFQTKLGSIGEKVRRIGEVATSTSGDALARDAAGLCKADLVSLIVGEFPELQGLMGRWYAQREGLPARTADAIRDHYLPKGASDAVPAEPFAAHLAAADRIDTLVGCFGIGIVPTGSADPFALRRAMLSIARIALEGPIDVRFASLARTAHAAYLTQGKLLAPLESVLAKLDEFARTRLRGLFPGHEVDVIEACLAAWDGESIRDLSARIVALTEARAEESFASLAVAFKRAYNISKDATPGAIDPRLFDSDAERALAEAFERVAALLESSIAAGAYLDALRRIASDLRAPIDRFFTEVFVMVDDADVRANRLRLLKRIASTINGIAHFHLLAGG